MKKPNIKPEIVTVTPALAKEWLEHNQDNRPVRMARVSHYAHQIKLGQWTLTGQPILFDSSGRLATGQHRLLACIQADTPFTTMVVRGIDPGAVKNIDTGASWSYADIAQAAGFKDSLQRVAAIRVALMLDQQRPGDSLDRWRASGTNRSSIHIPSITEVLEFAEAYAALCDRMLKAVYQKTSKKLLHPTSTFGGLFLHLYPKNSRRCDEFFAKLASGADLRSDDPIFRLREHLIQNANTRLARGKRRGSWSMVIAIKAWNAWMRGEPVKLLRVGDNEKWPKIETKKSS